MLNLRENKKGETASRLFLNERHLYAFPAHRTSGTFNKITLNLQLRPAAGLPAE